LRIFKIVIVLVITFSMSLITSYGGEELFLTEVSPEMKPGSQGDDVKKMQQRLMNWGYLNDEVNGTYDQKTFKAVKEFQKWHGFQCTGLADRETLKAIGMTRLVEAGTVLAEGNGMNETQLLARAINGEARGEPYIGQVAVGAVIINRTRDSKFPKTIPGVIYQPGAFTAVSDGQINTPIDPNSSVVKAARDALNGFDPTYGCIYYWNPATATSKWIWSRQVVAKIGKHYFAK